jgi:hypothetical protein
MNRSKRPVGFGWGALGSGDNEVITVREASRRLGLGRKAIGRLTRMGLKTFAVGRINLCFVSELVSVLRACRDEEARR